MRFNPFPGLQYSGPGPSGKALLGAPASGPGNSSRRPTRTAAVSRRPHEGPPARQQPPTGVLHCNVTGAGVLHTHAHRVWNGVPIPVPASHAAGLLHHIFGGYPQRSAPRRALAPKRERPGRQSLLKARLRALTPKGRPPLPPAGCTRSSSRCPVALHPACRVRPIEAAGPGGARCAPGARQIGARSDLPGAPQLGGQSAPGQACTHQR